ncbi:hypothetical protein [Streptomyces subrutilus]|uniref:Uncharacterized protein n=1 Tax=Streptomyces subrutilus TaxID=36818 RepID=A0A1E5PKZ0_9ACTN|nr:hypothetical protein [Streptomyces subrutilus]OEJ30207.1 hypothetical protein BGK67_01455 [Streptomyces subrutilus]
MTVDIRLTTPARLTEVLALDIDAVSIGQEGCHHKLPDTDTLRHALDRIRTAGLRAGLVLPTAWQRHATTLADTALTVAKDGPLACTVNDLGTLAHLAAQAPAGCELALGLALRPGRAHDAAEQPRRPDEPTVYDEAFLTEYAAFGVRVLEADPAAVVHAPAGWRVRRLADVTPVAWARACPTARHHQLTPPHCATACDTPVRLTATHRWQLGHGHREPVPVADRPHQPHLTVYGNTAYAQAATPADPADPAASAEVIVDARFHTPQQLAAHAAVLRPALAAHP